MAEEGNGVFEKIIEGLQRQVDSLDGVVDALDHKIRGNGQPGMAQDLAVTKQEVEHISKQLTQLESRIVGAIDKGLQSERERIQSSLKDTGELTEIVKRVAREVAQMEVKEAIKDKEMSPGSWRYFAERWGIPVAIFVVIEILAQWLTTLLK